MKWGITKRDNPEHSPDLFNRDVDRFFDDFFSLTPSALFKSDWLPRVDVTEDEKSIHVTAEIPGIDEKDLNIELENNCLTISGEKKEENDGKKKGYTFSERKYGSFSRTLEIPDGVKADEIKANYKKGVLTIEIPKNETTKPKAVNIKVN